MKTTSFLSILLMVITLWGCSQTKEPQTVQFESNLTANVNVSESGAATDKQFSTFTLLDATTDPQISNYASSIESYEVESISFAIINYSSSLSDEIYFNGDFGFGGASASAPEATCTVSFLNITHVAGTGDFAITPCSGITNDIATAFGKNTSIKIFMDGVLSKTPLTFTVQIKLKVKVTALAT